VRQPTRNSSRTDREEALSRIAEEITERLRRGERVRVADYRKIHPEYAEEILDLIITVQSLEDYSIFSARTTSPQ